MFVNAVKGVNWTELPLERGDEHSKKILDCAKRIAFMAIFDVNMEAARFIRDSRKVLSDNIKSLFYLIQSPRDEKEGWRLQLYRTPVL